MSEQQTKINSHLNGSQVRVFKGFDAADYQDLGKIGINASEDVLRTTAAAFGFKSGSGMDDAQGLVTTQSAAVPLQYLQAWLPETVEVATAVLAIDEIVGVTNIGSWESSEVVIRVSERVGQAGMYADNRTPRNMSSNYNYERRTIVRSSAGFSVGKLEGAQFAQANINAASDKKKSTVSALNIFRNAVGFFGYNAGANRTYGFLNDPNLPSYVTAAATGSGSATTWASKTAENVIADLKAMAGRLRVNSKGVADPLRNPSTLVLPLVAMDSLLTTLSGSSTTVKMWLLENYPKVRVVSAPEMDTANGGASAAYWFVDGVANSTGTVGTFLNMLPSRAQMLYGETIKGMYEEGWSNATAGVTCTMPVAVQRLTGI